MAKIFKPTTSASASSSNESSTLHAIVFIAKRLGLEVSYTQLRRSYVHMEGEPKNPMVVAIARDLGIVAKPIKIKFQNLPRLKKLLPAIVRVNDGASLVLESVELNPVHGLFAVLRDATRTDDALTTVNEDQLGRIWDGQVILLKRNYAKTDEQQPFGMGWLFGQVLREGKLFRDIAIGALISTIFALTPPFIFRIVLDRVLSNQSFSTLEVLSGGLALMILFETILMYFRRQLMEVVTARIDGRLNLHLMEKLLKLPMEYFERNPTGRTMHKISRLWQIRNFLTGTLFSTFLDAVPLIGIIPVMFILSWQLATLVLALAFIVFLIVLAFIRPLARQYSKVSYAENRRGAHLTESIYGMRTIKSLVIEGRRRREWDERIAASMEARYQMGTLANYPSTFSMPFERMMYSGVVCVGAYLALTSPDSLSAGALGAFAMLAMRLTAPLVQIARLQLDLAEVRGAVTELADLLNTPSEDSREQTGMRPEVLGQFEFKDVSFRYSFGSPLALDAVNLKIPAGTMLGVMGRSGSGKTTIARLLQRLHSSYDGLIKLDGVDIREFNLAHLRSHLGVVLQENYLFSGSIRENISIARADATLDQIVRAAQLAGAEEFIERMPRGYETILEEGATNLSGGQRQRLAIARALLSDPPVLILDEATSALDAESEAIVNANLRRIAKGRTVISISHRLSMLVHADAILVLERGKVYDIGSHKELLKRCDIYKQLWHQQNRHTESEEEDMEPLALSQS
jgi:ATP-binding cassette subfamily B protein